MHLIRWLIWSDFVQKKLEPLNFWEDPYYLVKENMKAGISMQEQGTVCSWSDRSGVAAPMFLTRGEMKNIFLKHWQAWQTPVRGIFIWVFVFKCEVGSHLFENAFYNHEEYTSDGNSLKLPGREEAPRWDILCGCVTQHRVRRGCWVVVSTCFLFLWCVAVQVSSHETSILLFFVIKKITHSLTM